MAAKLGTGGRGRKYGEIFLCKQDLLLPEQTTSTYERFRDFTLQTEHL
jgi:hypothetical protein